MLSVLKLWPNRRVLVTKEEKYHDTARFLRAQYKDGELQITVKSDALGGEEIVFWFFREEKSWRFLTQDRNFNLGIYDLTSHYLIEGL